MSAKPTVMIMVGYYLPGFRAGGPIRSLSTMVDLLADEYQFRIVASDRDLGDDAPYPGVVPGKWQRVEQANVCYLPRRFGTARQVARQFQQQRPDVLYANGFFGWFQTATSLLLRRFGWARGAKTVIAPRGEFSRQALAISARRKQFYLRCMKATGALRDVIWHATSPAEEADIRRVIGDDAAIALAPDLARPHSAPTEARPAKVPGRARFASLSRVAPIKNLLGALEMLDGQPGEATLDIFGPVEDQAYWQACQRRIAALSANIRVNYRGMLPPEQAMATLAAYDAMLLPTQSENFGHAIAEALLAGCPPIISDQTPWRDLATRGAGWDLPLADMGAFREAVAAVVAMDEPTRQRAGAAAIQYGQTVVFSAESVAKTAELLRPAA